MIEEKRDTLNLKIREILGIIDMIDGIEGINYPNYEKNSLDEEGYLDQQQLLVNEILDRLVNIFKD